jgi:hypothetical protein
MKFVTVDIFKEFHDKTFYKGGKSVADSYVWEVERLETPGNKRRIKINKIL